MAAMGHGIVFRYGAFIHVKNGEGHFKALRDHIASMLIHASLTTNSPITFAVTISIANIINTLRQPGNRALDNPFPHPPMQLGTTPRHLHIHHACHITIDLCDYHS